MFLHAFSFTQDNWWQQHQQQNKWTYEQTKQIQRSFTVADATASAISLKILKTEATNNSILASI